MYKSRKVSVEKILKASQEAKDSPKFYSSPFEIYQL